MPCSARTSKASSTWNQTLKMVAKLQMQPERMPRTTEAQRGMMPEVGVAATRPEMMPEQRPTVDQWFVL